MSLAGKINGTEDNNVEQNKASTQRQWSHVPLICRIFKNKSLKAEEQPIEKKREWENRKEGMRMWSLLKCEKYIHENGSEADYSVQLITFNDLKFEALLLRGLQKIMCGHWEKEDKMTLTCWGRWDAALSETSLWERVFFSKWIFKVKYRRLVRWLSE